MLVRYSQLSFYFNECQISTREKSHGNPLDVTRILHKNLMKFRILHDISVCCRIYRGKIILIE